MKKTNAKQHLNPCYAISAPLISRARALKYLTSERSGTYTISERFLRTVAHEYVFDGLEPHVSSDNDNAPNAVGLAKFAEEHGQAQAPPHLGYELGWVSKTKCTTTCQTLKQTGFLTKNTCLRSDADGKQKQYGNRNISNRRRTDENRCSYGGRNSLADAIPNGGVIPKHEAKHQSPHKQRIQRR
ncbi:MAG: hypothetical protein LBF68_06200 [Christensenellaceae bacterium]|nr:hypothetical protein [Christensenellaceae bacterium]